MCVGVSHPTSHFLLSANLCISSIAFCLLFLEASIISCFYARFALLFLALPLFHLLDMDLCFSAYCALLVIASSD